MYSRSTDFEVHRHWLAITHSLPIHRWYIDTTSEWTLDYPPFFAWFEWSLGHVAHLFDRDILTLTNLNYASSNTVVFLRLSVILVDISLAIGCFLFFKFDGEKKNQLCQWILSCLMIFHPALLIIDHIHFQYNGFLFGMLLLSFAALKLHHYYLGALVFAVLLNLKHIFLYIALPFFVYLLSTFCFKHSMFQSLRFFKLGGLVITVFFVSFGPFINQLPQLLSRLFPFKRGLCHVYWAPNMWAIFSFADRVALFGLSRLGQIALPLSTVSPTQGILGDFEFSILPQISPSMCLLLTMLAQVPFLCTLWRRPHNFRLFLLTVAHCGMAAFMFGWHVHEKAVLLVLVPLLLLALESVTLSQHYFVMNMIAMYSLFPLLIDPAETVIKWCILVSASALTWTLFAYYHHTGGQVLSLPSWVVWYLVGFAGIEWFSVFGHPLLFGPLKLPFLPLMLTSVYCALGLLGSWLSLIHAGSDVLIHPVCSN